VIFKSRIQNKDLNWVRILELDKKERKPSMLGLLPYFWPISTITARAAQPTFPLRPWTVTLACGAHWRVGPPRQTSSPRTSSMRASALSVDGDRWVGPVPQTHVLVTLTGGPNSSLSRASSHFPAMWAPVPLLHRCLSRIWAVDIGACGRGCVPVRLWWALNPNHWIVFWWS
jgi:hypothetical protein